MRYSAQPPASVSPCQSVTKHGVQPVAGAALPLVRLSASAYADLRHCPYRFYALRLLGLQESDELDATLDKRDFGTWLHAVLQHFHEALCDEPEADRVMLMISADDEWIECIECGHIERRPTEVVTKDPDHAPATTDVVGVVQFRPLR